MSSVDPFETFAPIYDRMPRDEKKITEFFRTLIEQHAIRSILDCACGTGSDLVVLRGLCPNISGSDISDAMLERARQKLVDYNLQVPLARVNFRDLPQHFDSTFDMLLCMSTSSPQIPDETDVRRALRSMRAVLNPGGILVISQGLTDKLLHARPRFVPIINSPDQTRIMAIDYLARHWRVHVLDCFRTEPNAGFRIHSFDYLKLLEDDYRRLLMEAAFTNVHFYGNYDLEPYDREKSDALIVVAQAQDSVE